ncbi:MAG TPA: TetR/AcrR family transcriptional regulator [Gemmatimonadaceae bacterium]|nr:TetR/AcrR family transcriptional regulator [Gemmatimonadaceae bacterium]
MTDAAVAIPALPRAGVDKREAILAAALRLIARLGLHNTPMSAVAREAGVAAGTLYLYFPSKEAMINALYLDVLEDRDRSMRGGVTTPPDGTPTARDGLWSFWHGLARWHLDRPDASNFMQQCKASAILTEATREVERRNHAEGLTSFEQAVAAGHLRAMPLHVFWALAVGPITQLAQMCDAGELAVTDDVIRATFDGVCRSVLPDPTRASPS